MISVMMPSRPSEPCISASTSRPGESNARLPTLSQLPSAVKTLSSRTLCTVRPYFRQCTPPEFSATLPPIEHAICEDGSGA